VDTWTSGHDAAEEWLTLINYVEYSAIKWTRWTGGHVDKWTRCCGRVVNSWLTRKITLRQNGEDPQSAAWPREL